MTTKHTDHQKLRRDKRDVLDRDGKVVKKAHTISGRTFVVIADVIVYKLGINEDTWFEQQVIDNGIVLRMCKL